MSLFTLFDATAEEQAYQELLGKEPMFAAGNIVVGVLGMAVGLLTLANHSAAISAGLTWAVLKAALGVILWRFDLRQNAKNRWVLAGIVGLLAFNLWA